MSIDTSKITGWSDSVRGNVTQITDASGRVIWSGRELIQGSMILRPSADIYVGHSLYPSSSTHAYLLINEETSDGSSTIIKTETPLVIHESKFVLSNTTQLEVSKYTISSVVIYAQGSNSTSSDDTYTEFVLEINGTQTSAQRVGHIKSAKSVNVFDAIPLINEAVAVTGTLPSINIIIRSFGGEYENENKGTRTDIVDLTQVYVTMGYEGY